MVPNFLDVWPKAGRRELEAELTARVLEERLRLAEGRPRIGGDRKPACVRGLSWLYTETPAAVEIRLDGDLHEKDEKPWPLRFQVRKVPLAKPAGGA